MIDIKRFLQKISNSTAKRLINFINLHSDFYISAKPDFQRGFGKLENFKELYCDWTARSRKANIQDMTRFYMLYLIADYLKEFKIPGEIAELGVYRGSTAKLFKNLMPDKSVYLFDTYEGFSETDLEGETVKAGECLARLDEVKNYVGEDRAFFIKGYFPESALQLQEDIMFSLVHLDADLYKPQMEGLKYFYPKLSKGGVLIVHDCNNSYTGSRKALDEFFGGKLEKPVLMPDKSGTAAVIKL